MRSINNVHVVNSEKSVRVSWHALTIRCPSSRISGGTFCSSSSMLNSPCSFSCVDSDKTFYREHCNFTLTGLCLKLNGLLLSVLMFNLLNLLFPWCTNRFNIQQIYVLPTLYLCVLYLSKNKQRLVPLTA